jgi:hypothetical protein
MIVQKQPNNWSCLVTAFAIICELPVEELIKRIGHDGSKVVAISPPYECGFHIQEIIDVLYKDFSITEIIDAAYDDGCVFDIHDKSIVVRIADAMEQFSGVLWVDNGVDYCHAYAWDHTNFLLCDPKRGNQQSLSICFKPCGFWIVEERKQYALRKNQVASATYGEGSLRVAPLCTNG